MVLWLSHAEYHLMEVISDDVLPHSVASSFNLAQQCLLSFLRPFPPGLLSAFSSCIISSPLISVIPDSCLWCTHVSAQPRGRYILRREQRFAACVAQRDYIWWKLCRFILMSVWSQGFFFCLLLHKDEKMGNIFFLHKSSRYSSHSGILMFSAGVHNPFQTNGIDL